MKKEDKKRIWEESKIEYFVKGEKVEETFKEFFQKRPFYHFVKIPNSRFVKLLIAHSASFDEKTTLPNNLVVTTITPLAIKTLKPIFKWGFKNDLR